MLKIAVIGVGYLGKFHAEKVYNHSECELVGVVDKSAQVVQEIAEKFGVPGFTNCEDLPQSLDAVSIAASTQSHYSLAKYFLERGQSVFLEKPMTSTLDEARDLVSLARKQGLVLQVGHIERFNPVFLKAKELLLNTEVRHNPLFISSERIGPFKARGADVDVVLDLMIHDLDLVCALTQDSICKVEAFGEPLISSVTDIAEAWIKFSSGLQVHLSASRVSQDASRKMCIFDPLGLIELDFLRKKVIYQSRSACLSVDSNRVQPKIWDDLHGDPLKLEIDAFVKTIRGENLGVSGQEALRAMELAEHIRLKLSGASTKDMVNVAPLC